MAKKAETEKKDYDRLRIVAEGMFITQNLSAREISAALDVSEVTISRWRQGVDGQSWDDKKRFVQITPARLREKLLREAENVANGEASVIKADVIVKLLAAVDKLASKATPEVVYSVLVECTQYISTIEPKDAAKMAEYHRAFLQHKISKEL